MPNSNSKITIVISQQYGLGNFVVDSAMMRGNYWNQIPQGANDDQQE